MLKNITVIHFSPTGGTRNTAFYLAESMAEQVKEVDLFGRDEKEYVFGEEDTVIIAAPVYGGRIPSYMVERLKLCRGKNTGAVVMAVYGNRAYEDALAELSDCAEAAGFKVAAGIAALAEHSIVREVAAGRPDEEDRKTLNEFGGKILLKLGQKENGKAQGTLEIPGDRPYKVWIPMQPAPVVSDLCTACGLCAAECPTQAISIEDPTMTDPKKCMFCMHCVVVCPSHARALPEKAQEMINEKLSPLKAVRRENELFI